MATVASAAATAGDLLCRGPARRSSRAGALSRNHGSLRAAPSRSCHSGSGASDSVDLVANSFGAHGVTEIAEVFLGSSVPLTPSNAVAALLVLPDGRYVMQLRDLKPHIFYPGHWGLFGGAVDEGEDERQALSRELAEELGFRP